MAKGGIDHYYETLELGPGASLEEIRRAYRDLVKIWHPDRFTHDPRLQERAQEKLKKINEAYSQLSSIVGNKGTKPRANPAEPQTQRPRESWVTDLRDSEVVHILEVHPEDSYFNQRRELLGTVIRVWGDVHSRGHGWYCIRATIQAPSPASHHWSAGDVIYFSSIRVSRM